MTNNILFIHALKGVAISAKHHRKNNFATPFRAWFKKMKYFSQKYRKSN